MNSRNALDCGLLLFAPTEPTATELPNGGLALIMAAWPSGFLANKRCGFRSARSRDSKPTHREKPGAQVPALFCRRYECAEGCALALHAMMTKRYHNVGTTETVL